MSPDPSTELKAAARQATAWLYETALPLWLEHGVDRRRGGFYEALSHHDLSPVHDYKRLRVLSRQIYVFSQGRSAASRTPARRLSMVWIFC